MDKLSQLVFDQQQIATYNTIATELGKSIDEASNLIYQFYTQHKSKLSTYFMVILKGSTEVSIGIERLSGKELLEKLRSVEYQSNIKQVKLWAVCDKKIDNFGIEEIYLAEKNVPCQSQHGIKEIANKLRTLTIDDTPVGSQNDKKLKPQLSKSSSFGEEKNVKKIETNEKNLTKQGSFDLSKSGEKKESMPLERKNTAEFGKKPSFTEEKPAPTHIQEEKTAKPVENKKKKAPAEPVEEAEQPLKKTKTTKDKEDINISRPKVDDLNSFFKKTDKKPKENSKIDPEDHPIGDTNEENLEQYFKSKKPSRDDIEEPPINITVKPKATKIETEEEYYDGYIEEPVRERSPENHHSENKPKKVKKEPLSTNYLEPKGPEFKEEGGKMYVRKTKTTMVEKTYMDEKGYLVSEQTPHIEEYWEEVKKGMSQNHSQVQTQQESDKKQTDKNQKSITSFFKKM